MGSLLGALGCCACRGLVTHLPDVCTATTLGEFAKYAFATSSPYRFIWATFQAILET
jgi:hypothetical protein